MKYALGNMLNGAGSINPDGLALDLQFAADKTLTARRGPTPVFSRGSTGTFVGSNGLIQSAAIDAPRFDHDPVTLASRGLLIEEQRRNLTWPSIYTTSNLGVGVFPTGSTTISFNQSSIGTNLSGAALVREEATTQVHGSFVGASSSNNPSSIVVTSGTVYTASIFVKADGRTKCRLSFIPVPNNHGIFAEFDISSTGSIITNSTTYGSGASTSGISASITKHIDGWFRLSLSGSLTTTTSFVTVDTLDDAGNRSFLGDTSKGLFIANAQLEAGSFATSYIPTTTSALTRSADVCNITGAAFSGFYNQPEGTLFADVTPQAVDQGALVVGTATTTFLNGHFIYKTNATITANGKRWGATTTLSPSPQSIITTPTDIAISRSKMSYGYKLNDMAFAVNGALIGTDNNGTMPTSTAFRIGSRDDGAYLNGHLAAIRYYKKRLPNAKLQALTA